MSDAMVNSMLARAIAAIETLGSGLQRRHEDRQLHLNSWHIEPQVDLAATGTEAPSHALIRLSQSLKAALPRSGDTSRLRLYLALRQPEPQYGDEAELASANSLMAGIATTLPIASSSVRMGADYPDLEAVYQACGELSRGQADTAIVVSYSSQANLCAGVVISVDGGSAGSALRCQLAGSDAAADENAIELSVGMDDGSGCRPLCHPVDQPGLPLVLLSIILMAQSLSVSTRSDEAGVEQWLSVKPLLPRVPVTAALVLRVRHVPLACDIRLMPAGDGMACTPDTQSADDMTVCPAPSADALDQALKMLEAVSGYALRRTGAVDDDNRVVVLDSLMAAEFASRFQAAFGKALPPAHLLDQPTVRQVVQRLQTLLDEDSPADVFRPRYGQRSAARIL